MIRSMTGYGRGSAALGTASVTAEIRTVNSRFLDLSVRSEGDLQDFENEARRLVQACVHRGKAVLSLSMEYEGSGPAPCVSVDGPLLQAYAEAFARAGSVLGCTEAVRPADLLGLTPSWLSVKTEQPDPEQLKAAAGRAVSSALLELTDMRDREGAALEKDLEGRLAFLSEKTAFLKSVQERVIRSYENRFRARLEEILSRPNAEADEGRILTEVAAYADKTDYTEEVTRLDSHIRQFREILRGGSPAGRKLDFLVQEMNREINTTASKSDDLDIVNCVILCKTEMEKIREQIQNIE